MARHLARGMTLIELLAGLVVASLVAAIALTALVSASRFQRQVLASRRSEDTAWLVLGAIVADCRREGPCAGRWEVVRGNTLRYAPNGHPQPFAEGIASLGFIADITTPDGVTRAPLAAACKDVSTVTIRLTLHDGRRFERALACP